MKVRYKNNIILLLAASTILLSGCVSSPQSRFYTLTATEPQTAGPVDRNAPSIAIASVTIPELVNRPQMVVRTDRTQVEILETQRWAEPLKNAISRTIAENISRILKIERVSSYPQNASYSADFKVYVDIQRFEATEGLILVDALWTISSPDGKPPRSGRAQLREKITGNSYDEVAEAYSRSLGNVSRDIALDLKNNLPIKK